MERCEGQGVRDNRIKNSITMSSYRFSISRVSERNVVQLRSSLSINRIFYW